MSSLFSCFCSGAGDVRSHAVSNMLLEHDKGCSVKQRTIACRFWLATVNTCMTDARSTMPLLHRLILTTIALCMF
jgi:hypothetical protein